MRSKLFTRLGPLAAAIAILAWAGHDQARPTALAQDHSAKAEEGRQLELQYAQTYLKLVKLDLERADSSNRRVPGTVTPVIMDQLNTRVAEAEARLKALQQEPDAAQATLKAMEISSQIAAQRLQQAEAANTRAPGAIPELQLARMKVAYELAKLRMARTKALADAPREEQLAWEVEQLREEVDELRSLVMLLRERN